MKQHIKYINLYNTLYTYITITNPQISFINVFNSYLEKITFSEVFDLYIENNILYLNNNRFGIFVKNSILPDSYRYIFLHNQYAHTLFNIIDSLIFKQFVISLCIYRDHTIYQNFIKNTLDKKIPLKKYDSFTLFFGININFSKIISTLLNIVTIDIKNIEISKNIIVLSKRNLGFIIGNSAFISKNYIGSFNIISNTILIKCICKRIDNIAVFIKEIQELKNYFLANIYVIFKLEIEEKDCQIFKVGHSNLNFNTVITNSSYEKNNCVSFILK